MDEQRKRPEVGVPIEAIGEHTEDKLGHVATIRNADKVLEEAERGIRIARKRLQASIKRYEERARAPR